jgi:hypothetical protein
MARCSLKKGMTMARAATLCASITQSRKFEEIPFESWADDGQTVIISQVANTVTH